MKQKNMVPLKDLNLTNRFLFDVVAEDPDAHEAMLGIILGRDIHLTGKNQTEKEFLLSPPIRSIRMDVFSMDDAETLYHYDHDFRSVRVRKIHVHIRTALYRSAGLPPGGWNDPHLPEHKGDKQRRSLTGTGRLPALRGEYHG